MIDKIKEFLAEPMAQKILNFDEMLTPSLIKFAYWLCLLSIVWTGLCRLFSNGFAGFIETIIFMVGSALLARVGAELVILFFQMNENMETVAKSSEKPAATRKKVTKKASS